jgi:hypothetical protein
MNEALERVESHKPATDVPTPVVNVHADAAAKSLNGAPGAIVCQDSETVSTLAAKGLLRHSSLSTTLTHYVKDVPEVTANGMAQVEELFSELDAANQVVQ